MASGESVWNVPQTFRTTNACTKTRMKSEKLFYSRKSSRKYSYNLLQFVVLLGQCFALLPMENVLGEKPENVRFKWKSFKTLYSVLTIAGTEFMAFMALYHVAVAGYTLKGAVEIVFYGSTAITVVLFILLARCWSNLITTWTDTDVRMERAYGFPKNLGKKLKFIAVVVMMIAIVEHQFSVLFHLEDTRNSYNCTTSVPLYYKTAFPFIFEHIHFNTYLAVFVQLLNILSTFTWTYSDLFIIIISTVLVARFEQFTNRLLAFQKTKDNIWTELREDYDRLSNLCNTLDSTPLSYIVLTSYVINLFFILIQLYNSLGIIRGTMQQIYFFYSFGFLIFRTVAVSLYAAKINDESKQPAMVLLSVPSSMYNNEVQRLLLQINFDNIALTGCKLFKVKRGLILTIAGAIVTYELVLIQFNPSVE